MRLSRIFSEDARSSSSIISCSGRNTLRAVRTARRSQTALTAAASISPTTTSCFGRSRARRWRSCRRTNGNAGWLDDVHDVDANARSDLVGISHEFPAHVVVNDGGHDASLGAAHVFENKTRPGLVVCDGHRILRRLGGERHGNLCARCRIRSGGHALGSFQPRRPCVVRRVVDCCRGLSIYKLENHRAAPLPFAIRVRKCLPGTRDQLPPWLQARHGLLPLLRRPDNDSAKAGSEQLSQSCEEFPLIPRAPSAEKIESPIRLRLTYFSPVGKTQAFYSCKNN